MLDQDGEGAQQRKPDHQRAEQRQARRGAGDDARRAGEPWYHPGRGETACRSGVTHQDEVVPPAERKALRTSAGNTAAGVSALVAPVNTGGVSG